MNIYIKALYAMLLLGLLTFSACNKENEDITTSEDEDPNTEMVSCDLEVSIDRNSTGNLKTTITGGTAPFAYAWSDGSTGESTIIVAEGIYEVTVTDSEGCPASNSIDVDAFDPCFGLSVELSENPLGTLAARPTGGTDPYIYTWSTGESTETINVTTDGTYSVTITDIVGCFVWKSIDVGSGDPCNNFDMRLYEDPLGTLVAEATGGTVPYAYSWSTGESTDSITVTTDGVYSATVTDGEGCIIWKSIEVGSSDPCANFRTGIEENTPGTLTAVTGGGTAPYINIWSTGESTESITVTTTGTFSVTVTDINGCISVDEYER